MRCRIFLTGRPGIGKSSVVLRAAEELRRNGYRVGGMVTREVREGGIRVGFEIVDFASGLRGWLAHVNQKSGPKVGKYRVNLFDLETIGPSSILHAIKSMDVIIVDEIGPMELHSVSFKEAILQALESPKSLLGTLHFGLDDPFIQDLKRREDMTIFKVTHENRESLHFQLVNQIISNTG